jgi:release factor glutamine methyltransferase
VSEPLTIAGALYQAKAQGVDRLDAQRLLAHVLGRPRSWLAAHAEATPDAQQTRAWNAALARLADDEPLAYLVGEQGFHGLSLHVDANVLVPRPDTEVLVDWAIELLAAQPAARVVDLGTGSGAIALAVKHACPAASIMATDLSEAALEVARNNATRFGLNIVWQHAHWWHGLDGKRFDLVLSNPPYIAGGDPHLPALRHEPMLALTPGGDGLGALREIAAGAGGHLAPGGWLLLEHGPDQAGAVQRLLRDHGFADVATRCDLGRRPRCTGGRSKQPPA